jgi:hypothetical protein
MSASSTFLSAAPATASSAGCPACGSGRVIRLDLALTDGTPVVFTSCRGCERRSSSGPDGDLAVGDVLARTVKPGKGSIPGRQLA